MRVGQTITYYDKQNKLRYGIVVAWQYSEARFEFIALVKTNEGFISMKASDLRP